ncbi:MAG: GNAT family N-acetyltransferase [Actinomycetota bacterium]
MTLARHAVPADRETAIATLGDAFSTDPLFAHLFDPDQRQADDALMREVMTIAYDAFVVNGHSYVVDDRGAALWSPPGVTTDTDAMSGFFGERAIPDRVEAAVPHFIELAEWHPTEPHFYLQFIGARSSARGQGLGSLMLERVLRICDAEALPAYLEATTPQSAALYARHGFEQLTTITFADGIALLPMLRPPAADEHSG